MANEIIEIRDLRIGNILLYKGEYVHVTNLSCDIDDEYTDLIGFCKLGETSDEKCDWNRALAEDLKPIEINDDVLQKCGFKDYSEPQNGMGYRLRFDSTRELAWYRQDGFMRYQSQGSGFTTPLEHIKHFHQVQNFFYLLINKELAFKP